MTIPPDSDSSTDNAHLYRGLGQPPSAHGDPPASVVGPTGMREEPLTQAVPDPAVSSPASSPRLAGEPQPNYDSARPRRRGGGTKLLLGAVAVVAAALAYIFLPKFGFGPGNGHGGTSPGAGGAAPNPPGLVQATQPATASAPGVAATVPSAPLHLTIVNETYRLGPADGKVVSLDEVVNLAKTAKPGAPVVIDLIDSSRATAEEDLRKAFDQQQLPILWTRNGKPVTVDSPGTGKLDGQGDGGGGK